MKVWKLRGQGASGNAIEHHFSEEPEIVSGEQEIEFRGQVISIMDTPFSPLDIVFPGHTRLITLVRRNVEWWTVEEHACLTRDDLTDEEYEQLREDMRRP